MGLGPGFGVVIPNFGDNASPDGILAWVRLAEGLGFDLLMTTDHVAITADVGLDYPAPFYESSVTLAWLASQTSLRLGTTVLVLPYRHPLQTARMFATLDQLCRGRLIFGIGAGWARQEFDALGVPFERRGAIADEYLEAIRQAWSSDVASFAGRWVGWTDVHMAPRPLQRPHPPIWVGGSSSAAIRRAAVQGDAWHPLDFSLAWLRDDALPRLRAAAEAAGRPTPAFAPRLQVRPTDRPLHDEGRRIGEGEPGQVARDVEALIRLGATELVLDADDPRRRSIDPPFAAIRRLETVARAIQRG